ncbi:unnamed protein product [Echinostoma caproni]|uniref:Homeobox domain-containing protein n=1 Tax=Echinostoma caproni TaxID=27848 RepID=A0A183AA99_9TREM|nr:unnamed protein product [Echinostoma caproni]
MIASRCQFCLRIADTVLSSSHLSRFGSSHSDMVATEPERPLRSHSSHKKWIEMTTSPSVTVNAVHKVTSRRTTCMLRAWLREHKANPYPTKGEKIMLAVITEMSLTQISTWFANARRRLKKENQLCWNKRGRPPNDAGERKAHQFRQLGLPIRNDEIRKKSGSTTARPGLDTIQHNSRIQTDSFIPNFNRARLFSDETETQIDRSNNSPSLESLPEWYLNRLNWKHQRQADKLCDSTGNPRSEFSCLKSHKLEESSRFSTYMTESLGQCAPEKVQLLPSQTHSQCSPFSPDHLSNPLILPHPKIFWDEGRSNCYGILQRYLASASTNWNCSRTTFQRLYALFFQYYQEDLVRNNSSEPDRTIDSIHVSDFQNNSNNYGEYLSINPKDDHSNGANYPSYSVPFLNQTNKELNIQ